MKESPDLDNIIDAVSNSYNLSGALISAVILLSLLAMFSVTSYVVKDRDIAQYKLYKHKEKELKQIIERQKESLFTKRIYHAHHKAEKVVGFIKEDLRLLSENNLNLIRNRLVKYSSFIGRVIYDMKTMTPPINVIRNGGFHTNINSTIEFLINNIFKRVFKEGHQYKFNFEPDERIPVVHINEYVVWQILEPLIQNCIDHNQRSNIVITIRTRLSIEENKTYIEIMDNGKGFEPAFLETNEKGIKKIFLENSSTKDQSNNSGYGCYLAYESCKICGWQLDAVNLDKGAKMIISISHNDEV